MSLILKKCVEDFRSGRGLHSAYSEVFLDALIEESDEFLLAEVFRSWDKKGIDEEEIYGIAKIMRERCVKVGSKHRSYVDVVGTGGSGSKTFNVSTAAAFVVSAAGSPVAKHGNKAATSTSGSADALSVLGVQPSTSAISAEACLNELNLCFMFAPAFHRLSPTLSKVRRGLGFPTIFNCVGPLCNPAGAPHQLIGVWSREMVPRMANALARLGTAKSWVVHGKDGLDEISLSGPTFVAEVENGSVLDFEISPDDFGVKPQTVDGCRAETAEQSASLIKEVLEPNRNEFAARDLVRINAAAAIFISGFGDNVREAMTYVYDSIQNGDAERKLEALVEVSKC